MKLWKQPIELKKVNDLNKNTLADSLGIEFIEIGDDYIKARMPVDHRTKQPFGILHGGSNAALAEHLGSYASSLCIEDMKTETAMGVELNVNHLRSAMSGYVYGIVRPVKIGRTIHVWNIEIFNEKNQKTCVSRLTILIAPRRSKTLLS